ncbi:MAG: hypothetical protein AAGF71_02145 [Pseudomonadota bacterium]
MSGSGSLPQYANIYSDIENVRFTKLVDGRQLMTYTVENGNDTDVYFMFVGPNLEDAFDFPRFVGSYTTGISGFDDVKAAATPDGGFGLIYPNSLSSLLVTRYSADGTAVKSGMWSGNNASAAIASDEQGNILFSTVYDAGGSLVILGGRLPVFGSPQSQGQIAGVSADNIVVGAPMKVGDTFYIPIAKQSSSNLDTENILITAGPGNPADIVLKTTPSIATSATFLRALDNGDILAISVANQSLQLDIYNSDFSTLKSSASHTIAGFGTPYLLDRPEGEFALILNAGGGTASVFTITAEGVLVSTSPENYLLKIDLGNFLRSLDFFNLDDGGFGALVEQGISPNPNTFNVSVFGQGSIFPDEQLLEFAGRFDGGDGPDLIGGSESEDTLIGGTGSDGIWGFGGNDFIFLDDDPNSEFSSFSPGFETGFGGEGNDYIRNDQGEAHLHGEGGNDTLQGSFAKERAWGGDGDDIILLGAGADRAYGGKGSDYIEGGDGNDQISGGFQDDILRGGSGNDKLNGSFGTDLLRGGSGDDLLFGGRGKDTLQGGTGNDILQGDSDDDVFVFHGDGLPTTLDGELGPETDLIVDFVRGEDMIKIRGATDVASFADLTVTTASGITSVEYGNRIILLSARLDASDFDIA